MREKSEPVLASSSCSYPCPSLAEPDQAVDQCFFLRLFHVVPVCSSQMDQRVYRRFTFPLGSIDPFVDTTAHSRHTHTEATSCSRSQVGSGPGLLATVAPRSSIRAYHLCTLDIVVLIAQTSSPHHPHDSYFSLLPISSSLQMTAHAAVNAP